MEFKTPKSTKTTTTESQENEDNISTCLTEDTSHPETELINQSKLTLPPSIKYTEPIWAGKPSSSFKLTVIKDGKEINRLVFKQQQQYKQKHSTV